MNDTAKTANILVVDDNPVIRESLGLILEILGYQVTNACDGIEALAALGCNKPDLIITDINMPRMDGLKLLMVVKEQHPDIPVVVASGTKLDAKNNSLVKNMAAGFLQKPFGSKQIQAIVENFL